LAKNEIIIVGEETDGERLDKFIAGQVEQLSRSMVKNLINEGKVLVNQAMYKPSYHVREGDEISIYMPEPQVLKLEPRNIPLEIIYQDVDLAVINKPKGLVVHPAQGNWDYTLVNALLYHVKDLSGINGRIRPGIVHRLDKDTSGVMVVAKNDVAHRGLAQQIKNHTIKREYIALAQGRINENSGTINAPIGRSKVDRKKMAVVADGRPAISNYHVIERFNSFSLVKVELLTGRTHQIRVHFAYIKHPVVGDPLYGSGKKLFNLDSQALHAHLIGFVHPRKGEYMEFSRPFPEYYDTILASLRT
jgi:23S rRNA pseudouridine1911/1915/1917 synthase